MTKYAYCEHVMFGAAYTRLTLLFLTHEIGLHMEKIKRSSYCLGFILHLLQHCCCYTFQWCYMTVSPGLISILLSYHQLVWIMIITCNYFSLKKLFIVTFLWRSLVLVSSSIPYHRNNYWLATVLSPSISCYLKGAIMHRAHYVLGKAFQLGMIAFTLLTIIFFLFLTNSFWTITDSDSYFLYFCEPASNFYWVIHLLEFRLRISGYFINIISNIYQSLT